MLFEVGPTFRIESTLYACWFARVLFIVDKLFTKLISHHSIGRNGDALVNCYESRSVAASARYYRYKRNGDGDAPKATDSAAPTTEAAASENPATETVTTAASDSKPSAPVASATA